MQTEGGPGVGDGGEGGIQFQSDVSRMDILISTLH